MLFGKKNTGIKGREKKDKEIDSHEFITSQTKKKHLGFQSSSELYRLSDRHLLAKFNAKFCG
jgi:hypothetical protein